MNWSLRLSFDSSDFSLLRLHSSSSFFFSLNSPRLLLPSTEHIPSLSIVPSTQHSLLLPLPTSIPPVSIFINHSVAPSTYPSEKRFPFPDRLSLSFGRPRRKFSQPTADFIQFYSFFLSLSLLFPPLSRVSIYLSISISPSRSYFYRCISPLRERKAYSPVPHLNDPRGRGVSPSRRRRSSPHQTVHVLH